MSERLSNGKLSIVSIQNSIANGEDYCFIKISDLPEPDEDGDDRVMVVLTYGGRQLINRETKETDYDLLIRALEVALEIAKENRDDSDTE